MDPSPIKIAALKRGLSQKALAGQAEINVRRWYRLIEDLAVPTEAELVRISAATRLPLEEVRRAFLRSLSIDADQVGSATRTDNIENG